MRGGLVEDEHAVLALPQFLQSANDRHLSSIDRIERRNQRLWLRANVVPLESRGDLTTLSAPRDSAQGTTLIRADADVLDDRCIVDQAELLVDADDPEFPWFAGLQWQLHLLAPDEEPRPFVRLVKGAENLDQR